MLRHLPGSQSCDLGKTAHTSGHVSPEKADSEVTINFKTYGLKPDCISTLMDISTELISLEEDRGESLALNGTHTMRWHIVTCVHFYGL